MLNQLLDNIIAAPIRIFLLVIAFLVFHQIFTRQKKSNYNYRFFLNRISIYGAVVLMVMFVLVQLGMYHIFSLLLLLLLFGCFSYFNFKEFITYTKSGGRFRRAALIGFFRFVEKNPFSFSKNFKQNLAILTPKKVDYAFLLMLLISISAVLARLVFIENDEYTFSSLWIQKLEIVKNFDNNQWFVWGQNLAVGELAAMNLYSNIIGISKEMAIFTFSLFESFLITAFVFYIVNALTRSRHLGPLVAALSFVFLLAFLPVNINAFFQHSSIYLGFIFAFPLMIFALIPSELSLQRLSFFKVQLVLSLAIAFSDFYVMFIILPLFLIVAFVAQPKQLYIRKTFYAYLFGSAVVLIFKGIMCYLNSIDFLGYFLDNIIVIESYSDMPQLLIPEDQLSRLYILLGFTALFAAVVLMVFFKGKTRAALTFTLFYLSFLFVNTLDIMWLDEDLFNQTRTILVPVIIGVNIGMYYKMIKLLKVPNNIMGKAYGFCIVVLTVFLAYYSYSHSLKERNFKNVDKLKIDLLKVYDQLSTYQMKNTYAVVNQSYGFRLSGKEHIFMSYQYFLDNYLERDSIYQKIKNNKKLLLQNQEFILPQSVFVFVSDTTITNSKDKLLKTSGQNAMALNTVINTLKQRGNLVNTYFQSETLKVYEIVNKKHGSNLNEMIFKYENSN